MAQNGSGGNRSGKRKVEVESGQHHRFCLGVMRDGTAEPASRNYFFSQQRAKKRSANQKQQDRQPHPVDDVQSIESDDNTTHHHA